MHEVHYITHEEDFYLKQEAHYQLYCTATYVAHYSTYQYILLVCVPLPYSTVIPLN